MLAFQVPLGRGLRGAFPKVPRRTVPPPPPPASFLFCSGISPAWQDGSRPSGEASRGRMRHWAGHSFQLILCVPEQATGVLTGSLLAPVMGLSKGWPKGQIELQFLFFLIGAERNFLYSLAHHGSPRFF